MKYSVAISLLALALAACASAETFGQKKKKSKDKRFEAVINTNLRDYEGTYVGIDPTYVLEIRLGADGKLSAGSREGDKRLTLTDLKVEGARLTARKVYDDGATGAFEGTFSNRILNGRTDFGIVVEVTRLDVAGLSLTRIFYRRVQD
ncbi:MAG TPA: hypothetical protein VJT74_03550 [Pyrinomonadaceae bacterium]|nr:hypothetical protein [Pyrinomonadaceae bacterium]